MQAFGVRAWSTQRLDGTHARGNLDARDKRCNSMVFSAQLLNLSSPEIHNVALYETLTDR
jgi:hypothetical protein